jgi:hypothetical protein
MKTADALGAAFRTLTWPLARPATMAAARYELDVAADERATLARAWLLLAVAALAASGVFSILLVVARTPQLQPLLPAADFFRVALIVHVDLAVLVWFGAFAAALWNAAGSRRWLELGWIGWWLALLGALALCATPFVAPGAAVMANYVPVIDSALYLWGLLLFGAGFGAVAVRALLVPRRVGLLLPAPAALRFGLNAAAVAAATAVLAFAWSWAAVPTGLDAVSYYEALFWGPGHVIQFCWSLAMMIAWLWLATLSGARLPLSPRVVLLLFGIGLASVFITPLIYLAHEVTSVEFKRLFTWQMRFGGGLAIVPIGLAVLIALACSDRPAPARRAGRSALVASLLLFGAGGTIGFLIEGSDVRIPAHYHGSIVGITLALMGLTYELLPKLGYAPPAPRAAAWQPWLYGGGQLLHIVGLVWSGGYGVQRKVAGADQVLRTASEIAGMGLMGLGGLIAVSGGLLFALLVLRAVHGRQRR